MLSTTQNPGSYLADTILNTLSIETCQANNSLLRELRNTVIPTVEQLDVAQDLLYDHAVVHPVYSRTCRAHVIATCSNKPLDEHIDTQIIGYAIVFADRLEDVLGDKFDETCWRTQATAQLDQELHDYTRFLSGEIFNITLCHVKTSSSMADYQYVNDWPHIWAGICYGRNLLQNGIAKALGHGLEDALRNGTYTRAYIKAVERVDINIIF